MEGNEIRVCFIIRSHTKNTDKNERETPMRLKMNKALCSLLPGALLLALISGMALAEEDTHIVILATSDLHGNIWGYSYAKNA